MDGLRVESGSVAVLRLFDVASAIDLSAVERAASAATPTRIRLTGVKAKAIDYGVPPVGLTLGSVVLDLPGGQGEGEIVARIYEFGTVTIAFRMRAADLAWSEYMDLVNGVAEVLEGSDLWADPLARVRDLIGSALESPTSTGVEEDYLMATVHAFDRPLPADRLLAEIDLAPLLSGETRPLSAGAREDLLRNRFSYYSDDLVVLTWDRAFIVEPGGGSDVSEILEVANAQLLELRFYDALLDAELPRMYERVEQARAAFGALGRRRYANLARAIQTRVAEVTEIAERIDNALIVTEDVYLARIYGAALEQFRVRQWQAAVDRKLSIMRDTYAALFDEAATVRAEYLEWAIVLLIVVEIVLAFVL